VSKLQWALIERPYSSAAQPVARFEELGLKKTEMFTYKAADGNTTLYGTISFPSNFDPRKKYPALASVYGGPGSAVTNENFATPNATAEYGFLMLQLGSRSAPGQGRRVLDSAYMKLGTTEMDDMALGVKALWNRPYFDKTRVGIYGTSYGGERREIRQESPGPPHDLLRHRRQQRAPEQRHAAHSRIAAGRQKL
jgi:dipeptidyl-peptidase-4